MKKAALPKEILEQHCAILGKTGSGKTSTGKLAVEQVVAAGARVCILDPIKSDWWGLTSSADGSRAGLPFHILGGPHGHVPLHSGAGKAIAEVVASGALPLSIIDTADFEPGGLARFFIDFAPALLRRMKGVLHLVIEEAHLVAPKERSGIGNENMAIHWAKTLATAGRSKGIRLLLLSQRTQALHNALLGSCDTLIAHRFTAPADAEPVNKWLKANVAPEIAKEVAASLSSLKTGEGWICAGEAKVFERRQFPRIRTYDNTATPTGDAVEMEVRTASVNIDALRAVIGQAIEQAEASDPVKLRKQVSDLQATLDRMKRTQATAAAPAAGISKTDLAAEHARAREEGFDAGKAAALKAMGDVDKLLEQAEAVGNHNGRIALAKELQDMARDLDKLGVHDLAKAITRLAKAIEKATEPEIRVRPGAPKGPTILPRAVLNTTTSRVVPASPARTASLDGPVAEGVTKPQQRILDALAWLASVGISQADKRQAALLADASPTSGSYANNLGTLRTSGLIDYPAPGKVTLTEAGTAKANKPPAPPTTSDLHASLQQKVTAPQWRIMSALIQVYPEALAKDDLAQRAEASASSGSYANNLGALRSLGFIDYPRQGHAVAMPVLFLEGR